MSSQIRHARVALIGLLLLGIASCWPWRQDPAEWTTPQSREIGLEVRSQHFNDVVLYLVPEGQRRRLGVVTGFTTESIDLTSHPEVLRGTFRLSALPIGSREGWTSDPISAFPGDVVMVTLTSQIRMSQWHIR